MRNCNCAGSTCGCLVVGGTGVEVGGTGTAADPYTITNIAADLGTAFQVTDTLTLNLTKAGSGTNVDPIILSGVVTLQMQQLSDVNDPQGGPLNGEVPTYVGTQGSGGHWEFRTPAGAGAALFTSLLDVVSPAYSVAVTGNTDQTKGEAVLATANCTITRLGARLTTVAGRTYRLRVWEIDVVTLKTTQVGSNMDIASPGAVTATIIQTGAISINLDRGKSYLLTVSDTSGPNGVSTVQDSTAAPKISSAHLMGLQGWSVGAADPTVASTWVRAGAQYAMWAETVAR